MSSSTDKCHCRTVQTIREYSQFMTINSGNGMWKAEGKIISLCGGVRIAFIVYKNKAED